MELSKIKSLIEAYPDYPQPGVIFRDISPVLADPNAFSSLINHAAGELRTVEFDTIVAIDARGFIFGSAIAVAMNKGLVLCRKKGKLPGEVISEAYEYEYAKAELVVQKKRLANHMNVLIVDDVLATGNTALATAKIVTQGGARLVGITFMVEISFLKGKQLLTQAFPKLQVTSLIHF